MVLLICDSVTAFFAVLDPRISYEGAQQDYKDNPDLLEYLESSKSLLQSHYDEHYANHSYELVRSPWHGNATLPTAHESPSRVNFTLQYKKKHNFKCNELEEYFKMLCEDFDTCDALEWWVG